MRYRFVTGSRHYELVDWAQGAKAGRAIDRSMASGLVRGLLREPDAAGRLRGALVQSEPESLHLALDDSEVRGRAVAMVERGEWEVWELPVQRPACTIAPGEGQDAEPVDDGPTETEDPAPKPGDAGTESEVSDICVWSLEGKFDGLDEDMDDVFEGDTLKLTAEVVQGECEEAEAHFVVLQGEQEIARETVDPTSGQISFDYTTADVAGSELCYALSYRLEIGGERYPATRTFDVWAKSVTIRASQSESGAPMSHFKFKVIQEEGEQEVETGDDGSVIHELEHPATFTLEAQAPCEVIEWTREAGRVRECTGLRRYEAEFVAPVPPDSGVALEQFTNLPTEDDGRDQKSSMITVQVAGKGDADKAAADRLGAEGDRIYVQVTFGRESKRNSPAPQIKGTQGVEASPDGRTAKGYVELGAEGGVAEFQLELGHAGGDTCEVKIGTTPTCGDATLKFVNWRQLYYQLTRPESLSAPSLSRITDCLAAVFIRYEEYGHVTIGESDAGTPAGSWFDGAMMGLSGRCLNIGDHNKAFFHSKFEDAKSPLGVHVLFCHTQYDGGDPFHQTTKVKEVSPGDTCWFPIEGGDEVAGLEGAVSEIDSSANLFPLALQDGVSSIRNVKWKSLASSGEHQGKRGDMGDDQVSIDYVNWEGDYSIKLPDDAVAVLDAGFKVELKYTVVWSLGPYLGEADGTHGNWQLIVDMAETSSNDVMAHELGHTIGQVANNPAPGLSGAEHTWQYTGRGHQGSHCAFGADADVYSDTSQKLGGQDGCKCIMYGENSSSGSGSNGVFCEMCSPFLRAQDLRSVV